jgi:N-acetylglucosamine-6-phosphate deacetylase
MLITADTLVTGSEILRPGWVEVVDGRVAGLGSSGPPRPLTDADVALGAVTVVPGFVDMHTHGGGGGAFPVATEEESAAAVALHRRHGTTTTMASLVSAHPDELLRQVGVLADQVEDGLIDGIHLEGPWLSPAKKGAHEPTALRPPDPAEVAALIEAGRGAVRMVTIAPELDGAMSAIRQMVDAGVIAAVGHTDATYEQTVAAIDAGASVATHLFNAMRPVRHREPGPVVALMEDPRMMVELIGDGVHLHPALFRDVIDWVGDERISLVTDAMAAAGMPDGAYTLGALSVEVADGVAHLTGTDTIAGSTATMDGLFRFTLSNSRGDADERLLRAVRLTSINPARAVGFPEAGLRTGGSADLVVLGPGGEVTRVLRRGRWA